MSLRKILPLCSKWADNMALVEFVKTVHKFGLSYGWYLERSMRVKSLDVNILVNEFLDLVRINGEQDQKIILMMLILTLMIKSKIY